MKPIKDFFKHWGATRVIRLVLAGALGIAYSYNRELIYLFAGILLGLQAVLNISCPGGSCSTPVRKEDKEVIKTEKYEPTK